MLAQACVHCAARSGTSNGAVSPDVLGQAMPTHSHRFLPRVLQSVYSAQEEDEEENEAANGTCKASLQLCSTYSACMPQGRPAHCWCRADGLLNHPQRG